MLSLSRQDNDERCSGENKGFLSVAAMFCGDYSVLMDSGDNGGDNRRHGQVAADEGALTSLAASAQVLCDPAAGAADSLSSLSRSILLATLSSIVGAFGLSPARLPSKELEALLAMLQSIFEGEIAASFLDDR